MRLVNEKQKRVSELKGISAPSLRAKETKKYRRNGPGRDINMHVCITWH